MTVEEALISATVGAIVGGLCALGITNWQLRTIHRNALKLMNRQEFIRAAVIFRNTFMDILIFCREEPTGNGSEKTIADILFAALGEHEKAILLFRAYLPDNQRLAFDKTWNEYSRQDKRNELNRNPISLEYGAVFFDISKEKEIRHLVILRIQKLLDFAPLTV